MPPIIVARNLVKRYRALTAVDGVSFEVHPGECFGLLGPNGAGKTTTISMVCTYLPHTEATCWWTARTWPGGPARSSPS